MAASKAVGASLDSDMFSRVSVSRVSQVIVDQIRLLIQNGRLKPGDRLPSERDLCQRFDVSRVTVREALRVLEASSLVEIRVGARGGAYVTEPTTEQLGEDLADLLTLAPLSAAAVTEARVVFELGILSLVVERATPEDIADLTALVDEATQALAQGTYTMGMSAAFHVRVAECTHNPAIEMLVQGFHGPMLMSMREAQGVEPTMGQRGTDEHRRLVRAIKQGDLESAKRIMTKHLARTESRVKSLEEAAHVWAAV